MIFGSIIEFSRFIFPIVLFFSSMKKEEKKIKKKKGQIIFLLTCLTFYSRFLNFTL